MTQVELLSSRAFDSHFQLLVPKKKKRKKKKKKKREAQLFKCQRFYDIIIYRRVKGKVQFTMFLNGLPNFTRKIKFI